MNNFSVVQPLEQQASNTYMKNIELFKSKSSELIRILVYIYAYFTHSISQKTVLGGSIQSWPNTVITGGISLKQHAKKPFIVLYKQTYIEIEYIFLEYKITILSNTLLSCIKEYFAISVCHNVWKFLATCYTSFCIWNIRVNKLCLLKRKTPRAGRI